MNIEMVKKVRAALVKDYKHTFMDVFFTFIQTPEDLENTTVNYPNHKLSCGTIGCLAGRVCMIGLTPSSLCYADLDFKTLGATLLDIPQEEADELFYFHTSDGPYTDLKELLNKETPGTRAYARVVARALDRLVERYDNGDF